MTVVKISDTATGSQAAIAVEAGFNCFEFVARSGENALAVIYAEDGFAVGGNPPSHNGIPILFPFPNRIRSGKFSWDGVDYQLPESDVSYDGSGNAIHGFCLDRAWRVIEQTDNSVTGAFRLSIDAPERAKLWPGDLELQLRYEVRGTTLHCKFTVRNPGDTPAPWGLGTHSYFRLPLSGGSTAAECTVFAPVKHARELVEYLPNGQIEPVPADSDLRMSPTYGSLKLDNAYAGLDIGADGHVETRVADPMSGRTVVQRFSSDFQELVAFTPPWTQAICLEPYTCTTDAINLQSDTIDAGLQILAPGKTWTGFIDIEAILS